MTTVLNYNREVIEAISQHAEDKVLTLYEQYLILLHVSRRLGLSKAERDITIKLDRATCQYIQEEI